MKEFDPIDDINKKLPDYMLDDYYKGREFSKEAGDYDFYDSGSHLFFAISFFLQLSYSIMNWGEIKSAFLIEFSLYGLIFIALSLFVLGAILVEYLSYQSAMKFYSIVDKNNLNLDNKGIQLGMSNLVLDKHLALKKKTVEELTAEDWKSLASMYLGDGLISRDNEKHIFCLTKAVEKGDHESALTIAAYHKGGRCGLKEDRQKWYEWVLVANDLNSLKAREILNRLDAEHIPKPSSLPILIAGLALGVALFD